jgi:putative DNA methylase
MDQLTTQTDEVIRPCMAGVPSFIERQLPVSLLSKESYRERVSGQTQTLTPLGSYWKGRKPLVLVRAVVLGLLLPSTDNPARDRDIFLKLMLMDLEGLRRRKSVSIKADRASQLLPLSLHAQAFEDYQGRLRWRRSMPRVQRDELELQAFELMGTDEKLDLCSRTEEMPASAWDPVWPEVNDHLASFGVRAASLPELVQGLGKARFGHIPRVGDPFCGGGSIPFEAARIGCDVYASDLNPIACMLTWGAINVIGTTSDVCDRIALAQRQVARAVDAVITEMGIEHDGTPGDLRLPADAPRKWPHGWRVTRGGEPIPAPEAPYSAICPQTGWRVPMIVTRQVHEPTQTILKLVPDPSKRTYRLQPERAHDEAGWKAAATGTVVWDGTDHTLRHDPGTGAVCIRIANRARAFLYCLEVTCPRTGYKVPLLPHFVVSTVQNAIMHLQPDHAKKRFSIEVENGVSAAEMANARSCGTIADRALDYQLDGERHVTPMSTLRGDITIKRRYTSSVEEAADRSLYSVATNKYAVDSANRLRRWEGADVVPVSGDILQERLYCINWERPDGQILYASVDQNDEQREARVLAHVRSNLRGWQNDGLVPDMPIEPGFNTTQPIRERGWTHWHHLFTPRELLLFATLRLCAKSFEHEATAFAIALCRMLDWNNRLCIWRGPMGRDANAHLFANQALNTNVTYASRSWLSAKELFVDYVPSPVSGRALVKSLPAEQIEEDCDIWVSDPPYADAVVYHEITEFFIAWLRKNPPAPFDEWKPWDSKRSLAIQGSGDTFRRDMVQAYRSMARHMPENGLQVVMFTHQDTAVWADLAAILWAAGLQVTAGWCIVTETDSATRDGSYVQGTVLLVLRKRTGENGAFLSRLQRPVELAVERQLNGMRELNPKDEPDFGDTDFQLGAYAAALRELTAYATIDGRSVAEDVLSPTEQAGTRARVTALLDRARSIASDFLIPEGLPRAVWADLNPAERFYVKGMELEREGETRYAAFQEMARGFGIHAFRELLASTDANAARLKTAADLRARNLRRAGAADRAEDRELEDFAGGLVRHALYAIYLAMQQDDVRAPLPWFVQNLTEYWQRQTALVAVLDFIGSITTTARSQEAEWAARLAGAVRNHRP